MLVDVVVSFFLVVGAAFALVGSIGLARLDDFYMRLHGPTKSTTLGVGGMLVASAVFFSARGDGWSVHEVLVTMFLFITAPVSGHLLAKAALHLQLENVSGAPQRTYPEGLDETAATSADVEAADAAATAPAGPPPAGPPRSAPDVAR